MAKGAGQLPVSVYFEGKTYYPFLAVKSGEEAVKQMVRLRRNNYLPRVVYGRNIIGIYSYPKTPNWYSGTFLRKRVVK